VLGIKMRLEGEPPSHGVIVGNHLSYLDILVYGAVLDGVFVSKREVKSWPLVGLITRFAGTIYVDRTQRSDSARVVDEMAAALAQGLTVTFFPEGTSTDGSSVMRFRAALFDAPLRTGDPIWPAGVTYTVEGKTDLVPEYVCYWGDMVFGPHVLNFLRLHDVAAVLHFAADPIYTATDRFDAAQRSQAVVADLVGLPAVDTSALPSLSQPEARPKESRISTETASTFN
jgi:1-acyl-sn-glycerol-3-phosphate acyltransferase